MKHISTKLFFLLFILTLNTLANELHLSQEQALQFGFKPTQISKRQTRFVSELPAHSLVWPVMFVDNQHTIGNSMLEYQNYGDEAYYHEGSDLRVGLKGEVKAPVDGFLQGDYYSYVTDPNTGQDQKYTKPITDGGEDLYFEITIKNAQGFQFEFHHINAKTLPEKIYNLAVNGGGAIQHGETLGFASVWPVSRMGARYDHIHYNIISPEGVYMNAEYFSQGFNDTSAPVVKNIFAIYPNKKVEVVNHKLQAVPSELVISTYDMNATSVYQMPPTRVVVSWSESGQAGWDFTKFLLTAGGTFPDLREVYARDLKLDDGRQFSTYGNNNGTEF